MVGHCLLEMVHSAQVCYTWEHYIERELLLYTMLKVCYKWTQYEGDVIYTSLWLLFANRIF